MHIIIKKDQFTMFRKRYRGQKKFKVKLNRIKTQI